MAEAVVFYIIAAFTIGTACVTAFSGNIIRSAFSLLGTLVGVAAMFGMMGADFLAVIQVMIYVGGVMVLILFAVMLTHRIKDVNVSNRSLPAFPGAAVAVLVLGVLLYGIWYGLPGDTARVEAKMTPLIGKALVGSHVLPFLASGLVLLIALIGSVVIARREETFVCGPGEAKR
ncbi:MAG: NADH-quinone oxidoreductase subunit J [Deltaproteobacteria bacterium]|nr:NADH-quinone oxidoreductase subunit J [Deltaproteobacteria bacterium]